MMLSGEMGQSQYGRSAGWSVMLQNFKHVLSVPFQVWQEAGFALNQSTVFLLRLVT